MSLSEMRINFTPYPRQRVFIKAALLYDRTYYGGSVGSGKSYAAMSLAGILALRYPGITIRCIRETAKAAEQNLVLKFQQIYPEKAPNGKKLYKYNKTDKIVTWFHPQGNTRIIMDYCESYKDALGKQGFEQEILIIDEACNHEQRSLAYMEGRTRVVDTRILELNPDFKPKIIYTGNWIKNFPLL